MRFVFYRFTLSENSKHDRNFNVVQSYHENIHTLLVSYRIHMLCCVVLDADCEFKVLLLQFGTLTL
jgi:hypothetical protein